MQIVIIVTIVFFALTLAGTWLARRSAYSWADNEKSAGSDETATKVEAPARESGQVHPAPMASRPVAQADRRQSGPQRIVVTGFDTPKND